MNARVTAAVSAPQTRGTAGTPLTTRRPRRKRDRMEEASRLIDRAVAGPAAPLPHRYVLERRLGHSLGDVEVYHGPQARAALRQMGALAATRGWQILVAVPNPPLVTLAHEVIHVLQGQPAGQAAEPRLTREDATAEIEAERLAQEIAAPGFQPGGPIPIAGELSAAAISLQRSALAEPAPGGVATAEQPQELFDRAVSERPEPEPAAEPAPAAPGGVTAAGEGAPAGVAGEREGAPAAAEEEAVAAFELPPAPAPGVNPEDVAAREAAIAEAEAILAAARDVDSLLDAFAAAPPTVKAREQGQLGQRINELAQDETQQFQEQLPVLHAELNAQEEPVAPLTVATPASGRGAARSNAARSGP